MFSTVAVVRTKPARIKIWYRNITDSISFEWVRDTPKNSNGYANQRQCKPRGSNVVERADCDCRIFNLARNNFNNRYSFNLSPIGGSGTVLAAVRPI